MFMPEMVYPLLHLTISVYLDLVFLDVSSCYFQSHVTCWSGFLTNFFPKSTISTRPPNPFPPHHHIDASTRVHYDFHHYHHHFGASKHVYQYQGLWGSIRICVSSPRYVSLYTYFCSLLLTVAISMHPSPPHTDLWNISGPTALPQC